MISAFLILFKTYYLYDLLKYEKKDILKYSFASFVIYNALLNGISFIFKNYNYHLVVYYVINFLLIIDIFYVKHFHALTTINLLKQIMYVATVGKSIFYLFEKKIVLLFFDILFVLFFNEGLLEYFFFSRWIFSLTLIVILLLVVFLKAKFRLFIKKEYFCYHVYDVLEEVFKSKKDYNIDDNYKYRSNTQNKNFGIFKDKNLIIIQVEALQNFFINRTLNGEELTPNLNKLADKSIYFNNFYQTISRGNTSDAEFSALTSVYPQKKSPTTLSYFDKEFNSIARVMKNRGYLTWAFHGNSDKFYKRDEMYKNLGFDNFYDRKFYSNYKKMGFGVPDKDFLMQTIDYLSKQEKNFFAYLITLSSHTPFYDIYGNLTHEDILMRYIKSIKYFDEAFGIFLDIFEKSSMADNTVLMLYGDHFGLSYFNDNEKELFKKYFGYNYSIKDMMNIPLIIYNKNLEKNIIDNMCSQIDILPTILNLWGVDYYGDYIFGNDIFTKEDDEVFLAGYLNRNSFFTKGGIFMTDVDESFENGKYISLGDEKIDEEFLQKKFTRCKNTLENSERFLRRK